MARAKQGTVEQVRERIAEVQRALQAAASAPMSHAETEAALTRDVAAWAAAGGRRLAHHVLGVAHGADMRDALKVRPGPDGTVDLGPLLAAVFGPDALAAALAQHLAGMEDGPPAQERAARVAALRDELLGLEIEEERLIEQSEREGRPVARRGDADPRAVLAVHDQ